MVEAHVRQNDSGTKVRFISQNRVAHIVEVRNLRFIKKDRVLEAVKVIIDQHDYEKNSICPVVDYEAVNVSKKILRIVMSYTDYVNRTVWHKKP